MIVTLNILVYELKNKHYSDRTSSRILAIKISQKVQVRFLIVSRRQAQTLVWSAGPVPTPLTKQKSNTVQAGSLYSNSDQIG